MHFFYLGILFVCVGNCLNGELVSSLYANYFMLVMLFVSEPFKMGSIVSYSCSFFFFVFFLFMRALGTLVWAALPIVCVNPVFS